MCAVRDAGSLYCKSLVLRSNCLPMAHAEPTFELTSPLRFMRTKHVVTQSEKLCASAVERYMQRACKCWQTEQNKRSGRTGYKGGALCSCSRPAAAACGAGRPAHHQHSVNGGLEQWVDPFGVPSGARSPGPPAARPGCCLPSQRAQGQTRGPASRILCASWGVTWPPPSSNFLLQRGGTGRRTERARRESQESNRQTAAGG